MYLVHTLHRCGHVLLSVTVDGGKLLIGQEVRRSQRLPRAPLGAPQLASGGPQAPLGGGRSRSDSPTRGPRRRVHGEFQTAGSKGKGRIVFQGLGCVFSPRVG
jgi:hypothetical protein